LIQDVGLVEKHAGIEAVFGGAIREIELAMAEAKAADAGDRDEAPLKPSAATSRAPEGGLKRDT